MTWGSQEGFWVDLMIVDDNDIIEAFVKNKVLIKVDTTDATDMVGEEGNTIFVDAKYETISTSRKPSNQMITVHSRQRHLSKKEIKRGGQAHKKLPQQHTLQ